MRILLSLLFFVTCPAWAQYDAPGIDPLYGRPQPNQYTRLKNGGGPYPANPARAEFYPSIASNSIGAAILTWSNNNVCNTIAGGQLLQYSYKRMQVEKAWAKGYTGKGVKIGVIDAGYSNATRHKGITLAGSYGAQSTTPHTTAVISLAGGTSDTAMMPGVAPDASMYALSYDSTEAAMKYAIANKLDILNLSFEWNPTSEAKALIKQFIDSGGIIVAASGNNNTSVAAMQPICGEPGVICVGATMGGSVLAAADTFHYKNVLPVNGKTIDYALPYLSVCAYFDYQNIGGTTGGSGTDGRLFYSIQSGSSFTAPQIAGALALYVQRYHGLKQLRPELFSRLINYIAKSQAASFTDLGQTAYIPNLSKL